MPNRRILSLWFPRLAAERLVRAGQGPADRPFAVVGAERNAQVLVSLNKAAEAAGLSRLQPLRDAQAMCPGLFTRFANPLADGLFLQALRRWAGRFSPWVAEEPLEGLVIDLTGCAHLFGGESPLLAQVEDDCADLGLSVRAGIADTVGAAWAIARHAGRGAVPLHSGDAIDSEAPATRSRAARRPAWRLPAGEAAAPVRIAPPGGTRGALATLPVAALRLPPDTVSGLSRLGLRRIGDLAGQPRAALSRRFGIEVVRRLDQALGVEPEPVSPARAPDRFAVRLSFPDPIGLEADLLAALDRLLPALGERLARAGRGARRVRLQCFRADGGSQWAEVGLARPSADPERLRPLLAMKVPDIDAGFGIDVIRLEAHVTEPVYATEAKGALAVTAENAERMAKGQDTALDDLIGRLGARIGLEAITRLQPADSHIPEKTNQVLAAAWSEPAGDWPAPPVRRPLLLWRPEVVTATDHPRPPERFRWRGMTFSTAALTGPERIAPEWWLDEPEWRSGTRDYWRMTTGGGERLWLFYAHGGTMSSGWFCQGRFA